MLTTQEILSTLDNCDKKSSFNFITLEHPYIFTIDSRLNIFRDNDGRWAIVSEVLGYNPRGSAIGLEIRYFGNCLVGLKKTDKAYNYYMAQPIDWDSFKKTIKNEVVNPDAKFWLIRGQEIALSHDPQEYKDAGIELKEYEPGEISAEEVGRLLILKHRDLFRATDEELYRSIPKDLEKILVIDEWYHKEFCQSRSPFEKPKMLARFDMTDPNIQAMVQRELDQTARANERNWADRPGSYETWQQIAEVIVSGDPSKYQPTLAPNSHWSNWPEAGAL